MLMEFKPRVLEVVTMLLQLIGGLLRGYGGVKAIHVVSYAKLLCKENKNKGFYMLG